MNTMDSYSPENNVIVVGHPRSGNTWLARLLGEILDSPVTGWLGAKPLSEEGQKRTGKYVVRQLHLRPMAEKSDHFMPSSCRASLPMWQGEKVIHIFRDPRDVVVSVMHYWNRKSIAETIDVMVRGDTPLETHGPWLDYVNSWLAIKNPYLQHITYELLHHDTKMFLNHILLRMNIAVSDRKIDQAIEKQSFFVKREHIKNYGDTYNYGRKIQLTAMRKGIVGDWKNHFSREDCYSAHKAWGEFLLEWGYETNENWYKEIEL